MGPLVVGLTVYTAVILYMVMRKTGWERDTGKGSLGYSLAIPVSTVLLLFLAFFLIGWGVQSDTRNTMDFAGLTVSVEALRTASIFLGVGIVTGVTAGALISLVLWRSRNRERTADLAALRVHLAGRRCRHRSTNPDGRLGSTRRIPNLADVGHGHHRSTPRGNGVDCELDGAAPDLGCSGRPRHQTQRHFRRRQHLSRLLRPSATRT